MKWPFKFKRKELVFFQYQFLCKCCDIFFYRYKVDDNRCPICGRRGEIYEVKELMNEQ